MSSHYGNVDKVEEFRRHRELFRYFDLLGAEDFYKSKSGLDSSFPRSSGVVSCIDEGTPHGHIRFAGSGILNDNIWEVMETLCMKDKLKCITSHEECGAAKLYAQMHGLNPKDADAYAMDSAKKMANYFEVEHVHIPLSQMKRPPGMHTAMVIYYVGADAFDPTKTAGVPNGFVISRAHMDAKNAAKEAAIAADIAFGEHGFGGLFTEATPLRVVAIGGPEEAHGLSTQKLVGELAPIKLKYGDRVGIYGMDSPF